MSGVSVSTRWDPTQPMPPTQEWYFDGSEEAMEQYRRHLLNSVVYYPETTTLQIKELAFTEILQWALDYGFGPQARDVARDLVAHLLDIPKGER